ncbi:hypothetical protein PVAND_003220 [Polypedilum vanderplanki]|uniref:Ankyrin repeat protein n=1 Tax=Polypedilum vanderplanki TaxID=319348 RepID=A0A9J6BTW3_POLVA|nr:hypothetical protein PVAND_003220 [Polypedilum vanderplanki]
MFKKFKQKNVKVLSDKAVEFDNPTSFEPVGQLKINKIIENFTDLDDDNEIKNDLDINNLLKKVTEQDYVDKLLEKNDDGIIDLELSVNNVLKDDHEKVLYSLNAVYGKIKKFFFISFESSLDRNILVIWKSDELGHFLSLNLFFELDNNEKREINKLTKRFILASLEKGHLGISQNLIQSNKNSQNVIEIYQLVDHRGYNLLFFAADTNQIEVIQTLLIIGFSINERLGKVNAAEIAWKNKHYDMVFVLLKNNSCIPLLARDSQSRNEIFPPELSTFIRDSLNMMKFIEDDNIEEIEKIVEKYPNLKHFYNPLNFSAPKQALKQKNLSLYEYFLSRNIVFGPFEPTQATMNSLSSNDREKLRLIHTKLCKNLPEQHVTVLIANSNLGHDIDKIEEKRKYIEDAFYFLNTIAIVQILLRCVAATKKFTITFDFNRDNIQFLDPTMDNDTDGLFNFKEGCLSIGAKQMLNDATKIEVYAVIAHELCHYAMFLAYQNYANPYKEKDLKSQEIFEKILLLCMRDSKQENVIDAIFEYYKEDLFMWHAELIVRVPHLTVLYHHQPAKLQKVQKIYKPLFDYYETKVVKDLKKAIPEIIDYYTHLFKDYNWDKLNKNERNKIKKSKILFQGKLVKMNSLIDKTDNEGFRLLDSDKIKSFLVDNKTIEIGEEFKFEQQFYINRNFKNETNEILSFKDILDDTERNKFFIIGSHGSGKTTSIQKLVIELKDKYPERYILNSTRILRNDNTYNKAKLKENLYKALSENLYDASNFEKYLFEKQLIKGKVIIVNDNLNKKEMGVLNEYFYSYIYEEENETNIKIISIPSKLELLPDKLKKYSLEFIPYDNDNREEFVFEYGISKNYSGIQILNLQKTLNNLLKRLEINDAARQDVNNPSMIKIMLDNSNATKFIPLNLYQVYNNIFEKKSENGLDLLSDNEPKCKFRSEKNSYHQKLALEITFGKFFKDIKNDQIEMKNLEIMNRDYQISYLANIFGIFDLNYFDENQTKTAVYDTFLSFFIAQYFIENIHDSKFFGNKTEKNSRMKLFFHVMSDKKYNTVHLFISEYLKLNNEIKGMSEQYETLRNDFRDIFKYVILQNDSIEPIESISDFFAKDKEILKTLWRINDDETHFIWYFKESQNDDIDKLETLAKKYFDGLDIDKMILGKNQEGNILTSIILQKHKKMKSIKFHKDFLLKKLPENYNPKFFRKCSLQTVLQKENHRFNLSETILRNAYEITQDYVSNLKSTSDIKTKTHLNEIYKLLENDENKQKFVNATDWKSGNTVLHLIVSNEKAFSEFHFNYKDKLTKKLLLKQNYEFQETSIAIAVKSLTSNSLDIFFQMIENFDVNVLKRLLKIRDINETLPFINGLLNNDINVINVICNTYLRLNISHIIKESKNGSLSFIFSEDYKNTEAIFDKLFKFLNKVYRENILNAKYLFAKNDKDFENLIRYLAIPESIHSKPYVKFKNYLNISQTVLDEILRFDESLLNEISPNPELISKVKDFIKYNLNIYNSSQYNLVKEFDNDQEIFKIIAKVFNNSNENYTSIYSIFDSYITIMLQRDNFEEKKFAHQLLAIKEKFFSAKINEDDSITETTTKNSDYENYEVKDYDYDEEKEGDDDMENLLKDRFNALLELWLSDSIGNNQILLLINDYIQNEAQKQKFDQNLTNLIGNYITKINDDDDKMCLSPKYNIVTFIEYFSFFIKKDHNLLSDFWHPNELTGTSELFIIIVSTVPQHVEQVKQLMSNIFSQIEFENLSKLDDMEGIVLWFLFKALKDEDCDFENYNINKLFSILNIKQESMDLKGLKMKSKFIEFFNFISDNIENNALKNVLLQNPEKFIFEDVFESNAFEFVQFWRKLYEVLGEEKLIEIANNLEEETKETLVYNIHKIENDHRLMYEYLNKIKSTFNETEIYKMMTYQDIEKDSTLNNLLYNEKSTKIIQTFWDFVVSLNISQREFLKLQNEVELTAIFVSLHAYSEDEKPFELIQSIYRQNFNNSELQEMFLNASKSLISYVSSKSQSEILSNFIFEIFKDNKKGLLEYFNREIDGQFTIYDAKFHENEILKPLIEKATELLNDNKKVTNISDGGKSSGNNRNRNSNKQILRFG